MPGNFHFECSKCGFQDEDEDRKRLAVRARSHAMQHEPSSNHRDIAEQGMSGGGD